MSILHVAFGVKDPVVGSGHADKCSEVGNDGKDDNNNGGSHRKRASSTMTPVTTTTTAAIGKGRRPLAKE